MFSLSQSGEIQRPLRPRELRPLESLISQAPLAKRPRPERPRPKHPRRPRPKRVHLNMSDPPCRQQAKQNRHDRRPTHRTKQAEAARCPKQPQRPRPQRPQPKHPRPKLKPAQYPDWAAPARYPEPLPGITHLEQTKRRTNTRRRPQRKNAGQGPRQLSDPQKKSCRPKPCSCQSGYRTNSREIPQTQPDNSGREGDRSSIRNAYTCKENTAKQ